MIRRLRPFALLALGAAAVLAVGYLALRCIVWGWHLGLTEHRVLAGTFVFWAGCAIAFFAVILAIETRIAFLRARRDLRDKLLDEAARAVAQRLAEAAHRPPAPREVHCHACGKAMQKPYFFDRRLRAVVCAACVKKEERASAN